MADWLAKAQQAFGYTATETPQPFELTCSCGGVIRGMRQSEYQQVGCARCGEPSFVLPADVYPQPKPLKHRPKSVSPPRKTDKADPPKPRPRTASSVRAGAPATASRPAAERLRQRMRTVKDDLRRQARDMRTHAADGLRRAVARQKARLTPFRLVIVGIVAVVAGTGYWVMQRNAAEQAEITLRTASESARAALAEGDFLTASREFRRACDALEVLKRDDETARTLKQMLRESTSASQLLSKPLFDVISELPQASHRDPAHWQEEFRRQYADQWLVIETTIMPNSAAPPGNDHMFIDYPLVVGGKPVVIEADVSLFDRLGTTAEPKRVIFAAQLEGCRLRDEDPKRWVVTLRGENAFLWSSFDNYRALGFDFADEAAENDVRQLLEEQSRLLGVEL